MAFLLEHRFHIEKPLPFSKKHRENIVKKVPGRNGGTINKFEKGESGNPKGRPKKLPELDQLLADVLGEEERGTSAAQAILIAIRKKAKKGDVRAAELILNRAYGKPKDNEGAPTEMIIRVQRRG